MVGIFNLAPIWPLDGGQITGVLLSMVNRREGMRWTHIISLVTAGILAVVMYQWGQTFMPIFFALFALTNFQILQAMHHRRSPPAAWMRTRTGGSDESTGPHRSSSIPMLGRRLGPFGLGGRLVPILFGQAASRLREA